jgi:small subunit ribosomal protein S1
VEEEKEMQEEETEEESFAEMLDRSYTQPGRLEPGQKVEAKIVKMTGEWVFLDLGGKTEGCLSVKELMDDEGNVTANEGDTIQAYFLSRDRNEFVFTTRIGKGDAGAANIRAAFQGGIPVEGRVEKEVKGGFEIRIAGGLRGFCPYSELGKARDEGVDEYLGSSLPFRIMEFEDRGRNIVLSRKAVLEEERRRQREALRDSLEEGMTVRGRITSIRDFGAFLDIGAIEGLIPVSEIGWGRIDDIGDSVVVGQEVDALIMKLDWERDRFSFSLKQTLPDPWDDVEERYPEGSRHTGRVVRLERFGAFVNLEPGVDGLIHISSLGGGRRLNHPREAVDVGLALEVRVSSVDGKKRRLSLAPASIDAEAERESRDKQDDYSRYREERKGQSSGSLGTLGDLLKDKLKK